MTKLGSATPVLRIFDEAKSKEFYIDFLGFKIEFAHRFGDDFPLYMEISLSACVLHLSEHHGDACPGGCVRIEVDDIDALSKSLLAKNYKFAKPGAAAETPWNTLEMTLTDPFGNKLTFYQES